MDSHCLQEVVLSNFYDMLQDRNYIKVSDKKIIIKNIEYEDFYSIYEFREKKILCLILFQNDTKNKKKKILDNIFENPIYDKYIILHFIKKIKKLNYNLDIEYFSYLDFIHNITKHELQPKFKKIDNVDNIDILKLPKMLITDPVCRYYNFKEKDIILIDDGGIYSLRIVV